MIALTNLGHILIYKINEYENILINRIDVRQIKKLQQLSDIKYHKR
jgi:hypothetical protein